MIGKIFFSLFVFLEIALQPEVFADIPRIFDTTSGWTEPEKVTVTQEELFLNPPYTRDWKSRSFLFIGRLDDGTFFLINLFHWQFSPFQSWGLLVLVTDSSGRLFEYDGGLPDEDKSDPAQGFFHRFGENLFTSSGSEHRVKIRLSGFSCDLLIKNALPAWEPGDGWVYYDATHSAYSHYALPAPLATVNGTMTVFSNARSADGMCTWDSTLIVQPLGRLNSPQYSIRAFGDRLFVDMIDSVTDPSFGSVEVPVLFVAAGSTWLFTTRDFSLAPSDWVTMSTVPFPFPGTYGLTAAGRGWTLNGQFVSSRMYSSTDVFEKIPALFRPIVSLFLKRPILYRMVGELRGTLISPQGKTRQLSMPAHAEYIVVK